MSFLEPENSHVVELVCVPPLTSVSAVPGPAHPLPAAADWREKPVPGGQLLSKEIHTVTHVIANIRNTHTAGIRFAPGALSPRGSGLEAVHSPDSNSANGLIYLLTCLR